MSNLATSPSADEVRSASAPSRHSPAAHRIQGTPLLTPERLIGTVQNFSPPINSNDLNDPIIKNGSANQSDEVSICQKPQNSEHRVLPWLEEADWELWQVIDQTTLPETYEKWRRETLEVATMLTQLGKNPVWISIAPREFEVWCSNNRVDPCVFGRARFARFKATGTVDSQVGSVRLHAAGLRPDRLPR